MYTVRSVCHANIANHLMTTEQNILHLAPAVCRPRCVISTEKMAMIAQDAVDEMGMLVHYLSKLVMKNSEAMNVISSMRSKKNSCEMRLREIYRISNILLAQSTDLMAATEETQILLVRWADEGAEGDPDAVDTKSAGFRSYIIGVRKGLNTHIATLKEVKEAINVLGANIPEDKAATRRPCV